MRAEAACAPVAVARRLGARPSEADAEGVSWWAGRLLLLLAPSSSEPWLRRELLAAPSSAARLALLQDKLAGHAEGGPGAGCVIM